jgi:competence protein CoiA
MLYGLINNIKTPALPKAKAICSYCNSELDSKCGTLNIWHWADKNKENCDSWHESETDWHYYWKMAFGKDNTEVIITKEKEKHRADIKTKEEVVIELQNSPIQKPVISEREEFYGEKMIWVINGEHFHDNFRIEETSKMLKYADDEHIKMDNDRKKEYQKYKFYFIWNWAKKSWNEVKRHIFIDFGDESLFWVQKGMGTYSGFGAMIEKKKFFEKHGGDYVFFREKEIEYVKQREELKKIKLEKMLREI